MLNICSNYYNGLNSLREIIFSHKTTLYVEELLDAYFKLYDESSLYTIALIQHLYYFKCQVSNVYVS